MPANHPHLPSALEPAGCARRCTSLYGFSDRECHPLAKDPHLSLPAQGPAKPRGPAIGLELDCLHLGHPNSNQCGSLRTSNPRIKQAWVCILDHQGAFSMTNCCQSPVSSIWQKPSLQPHRYSNRCALARRCDHLVESNLDHLPNLRTLLANWIWSQSLRVLNHSDHFFLLVWRECLWFQLIFCLKYCLVQYLKQLGLLAWTW